MSNVDMHDERATWMRGEEKKFFNVMTYALPLACRRSTLQLVVLA
jgi:hypothetical protein